MDFDFSLILVVLTAFTGVVWLIDSLLFAGRRRKAAAAGQGHTEGRPAEMQQAAPAGGQPTQGWSIEEHESVSAAEDQRSAATESRVTEPVLVEYCRSFFPILLIVLILRSFIIEPFQIPSQSMLPTLEVGDFILVNKFTYGLRLPVLGTKIVPIGDPERGDIMVFRNPEDNRTNYIKRVIGLPGDTVTFVGKDLYINGEPVSETLLAALPVEDPKELIFQEVLGDNTFTIQKDSSPSNVRNEWVVPEGHYFMLGDNRDRSRDSRYIGFVPDQNIVGKAFAIWMHWESFFSIPSFSRTGGLD